MNQYRITTKNSSQHQKKKKSTPHFVNQMPMTSEGPRQSEKSSSLLGFGGDYLLPASFTQDSWAQVALTEKFQEPILVNAPLTVQSARNTSPLHTQEFEEEEEESYSQDKE